MKAILITGNPRYIKGDEAKQYYQDIINFVQSRGIEIIVDPGDDYTCPPKADFYIAHSRGCDRIRCVAGTPKEKDFLMFGDRAGFIHPVDLAWQLANPPSPRYNPPPVEHFEFIDTQKKAIVDKIAELTKLTMGGTRQDPMRGRPKPRG